MFDWLRHKGSDSVVQASAAGEGVIREVNGGDDGNWRVRLDIAHQRLKLTVPATSTLAPPDDELHPTCGDLSDGFVSTSRLAFEAKLFDDRLYAAVELASQPSKAKLLAALVDSAPIMAAAARLGGQPIRGSTETDRIIAEFLGDPRRSKPLGFYTWSDDFRRIFQQDRLLQAELDPFSRDAIAHALAVN